MPIFRKEHQKNFLVIDKVFLYDKRLSNSAKGLLTIMLSMADDWKFNQPHLMSLSKGRKTSLKTDIEELRKCGYLKTKKIKDEKGYFQHIYYVDEGGCINETSI